MGSPSYTFFLAHAGPDTDRAKALYELLQPDVSVFLAVRDLIGGDVWDLKIASCQRASLATVALVSSSVEGGYYLREEIASAIAAHRKDPGAHRLIPVYLDGVPTDPWAVPYGLRVQNVLDATKLGMAGVAAELRAIAASITGFQSAVTTGSASGAGLPVATASAAGASGAPTRPVDRFAIYDALCKVLGTQFDEILFRVAAPAQHIAPAGQPLARRALDLLQWTEQAGDGRMQHLAEVIRRTAPGTLT